MNVSLCRQLQFLRKELFMQWMKKIIFALSVQLLKTAKRNKYIFKYLEKILGKDRVEALYPFFFVKYWFLAKNRKPYSGPAAVISPFSTIKNKVFSDFAGTEIFIRCA